MVHETGASRGGMQGGGMANEALWLRHRPFPLAAVHVNHVSSSLSQRIFFILHLRATT